MEERASGIILRTRPLTETSLIVHLLTRELGRIALVAKGARRPKSPYAGKLDLFYEIDATFSRSRKSELHNLRETALREIHTAVRRDIVRLNAAAYATVLVELGTETETPIPEFYELILQAIRALDRVSPAPAFVLALETKYLSITGLTLVSGGLSRAATTVFEAFEGLPLEGANEVPLAPALFHEIELALRRAIGAALERLPPLREQLLRSR